MSVKRLCGKQLSPERYGAVDLRYRFSTARLGNALILLSGAGNRAVTITMAGMAKKKEATEASPESQDGALVKAAKAVGEAAGKIATAAGAAKPAKPRVPKLEKKNKARLPRKEKKAARKPPRKSA